MNRSRLFKTIFVVLSLICLTAGRPSASGSVTPFKILIDPQSNYNEIVEQIDHAKTRVHLSNFHLTHQDVVQALIRAAARPGVDVQVILDRAVAARDRSPNVVEQLRAARVPVKESSTGFTITHSKVLLADDVAMISTINLVRHMDTTRGVALFFKDNRVSKALEAILAADWANADNNARVSPANIPDFMVVSPVDSRQKLLDFIANTKSHLQVENENFLDADVIAEIKKAHQRGVRVEVVVPRCSFTRADINMPAAAELSAVGVQFRLMPEPNTAATPYIHAKFMIADDARAYVGSINFSKNSMDQAREIGVIAELGGLTSQIQAAFAEDFRSSLDYGPAQSATCKPQSFGSTADQLLD